MRASWGLALGALLGVAHVDAFPTLNPDVLGQPLELLAQGAFAKEKRQSPNAVPKFNAKQQYVKNHGQYKWVAPGPTDLRGPCPGLNVLANHGYLPHSGLATITQFVTATHAVFGMASDLSIILAAYGAAIDGQAVSWSIGGTPRIGIGGSHNNYETDSSPLRGDLHQYGSNSRLVLSQFFELYNMQPNAATANYSLDIMKEFRGRRFNESVAKNPVFYYAPFSGVVVSQAAYQFIFRFMANKSAEYPTGTLNKAVLKSWMSIYGPEDNLQWVPGHERIPDNFYRRNNDDLYTTDYLGQDSNYFAKGQKYIAQPGCNTGKKNSFVEIDPSALTNGAYTPADVLANPICFGLSYAIAQLQQIPLLGPVPPVLGEILLPVQSALGCVAVVSLNETVAEACPGYSLYGGPTGKVAKGAVQN